MAPGRQRGTRPGFTSCPLFSGAPKYIQGWPRSIPSPRCWGNWGGEEKYVIAIKTPRVFFKGPLATQLVVPPRQSKRMEKRGEKGREEGELGRHSSSCNFRICGHICVPSSEKEKSPQNHTTPLPLCFTQSSRTLKKAKVLLHPFEEKSGRWGWGAVLFLQKLRWAAWQGQSQDVRTSGLAAVFSGGRREQSCQEECRGL